MLTAAIIFLVLAGICFISIAYCYVEDKSDAAFVLTGVLMILLIIGIGMLFERKGAYNQLNNKYEITYEINHQGDTINTIINF